MSKKYDIYISDYKKTKVLKLPIIPAELPTITRNIANETYETYWNGTYNFIEKAGLNTLSIESWLPIRKYPFSKSNVRAYAVIELINKAIDNTEPVRIIIIENNKTYINDTFSVEGFEYKVIKNGNYAYTLNLKQWREYNV